jgi:hypothetical protein
MYNDCKSNFIRTNPKKKNSLSFHFIRKCMYNIKPKSRSGRLITQTQKSIRINRDNINKFLDRKYKEWLRNKPKETREEQERRWNMLSQKGLTQVAHLHNTSDDTRITKGGWAGACQDCLKSPTCNYNDCKLNYLTSSGKIQQCGNTLSSDNIVGCHVAVLGNDRKILEKGIVIGCKRCNNLGKGVKNIGFIREKDLPYIYANEDMLYAKLKGDIIREDWKKDTKPQYRRVKSTSQNMIP